MPTAKRHQSGTIYYRHSDGRRERVRVVKWHGDGEGGGVTVYIPSLGRERQTVPERLSRQRPATRRRRRSL
jgi:hypothetical protein